MEIHLKDLIFLIDIDPYISSSDLIQANFFVENRLISDLQKIKNHSLHYSKIQIIPENCITNKFNRQNPFDYFLKGNLPYYGHHLDQTTNCPIPFEINPNYIYVEDFSDLDTLESLAITHNATILSTKSFNRRSKHVFAYKNPMHLVEKLTLIKNALLYIGYDYSELAPLAKKILDERSIIHKSNTLSDEQLMFRFINEDNIDFFKI